MKFDSMITEDTKNIQVAPTIGIGKATEVVNCVMKKVNLALYRGEVFRKAEKVIASTLILKLNFLF